MGSEPSITTATATSITTAVQQPQVGGVAQLVESRSLAANFPCPALDLQLMGDH